MRLRRKCSRATGDNILREGHDYTIETDGRVVWINSPIELIGRFSRMGIDVHVKGKCVGDSCVPGPCTLQHWKDFQQKMLDLHRVRVPDKYMPKFLKGDNERKEEVPATGEQA